LDEKQENKKNRYSIIIKKEKMEINKKLIESYLNFLVKENFVKISKKFLI
jgi:hypothetical protein